VEAVRHGTDRRHIVGSEMQERGEDGHYAGNEEDDLLASQKTAPQLCRHVCGASEAKQEFLHIASCGPLGEATRGGILTLTLGRQFEISILRRSPF